MKKRFKEVKVFTPKFKEGVSFIVDEEDAWMLEKNKWTPTKLQCGKIYLKKRGEDGKHLSFHRVLTNAPNGFDVDHINGNELDNRKENLRVCTRSQNLMNQRKPKTKNLYKGVYLNHGSWCAKIQILENGKKKLKHLGTFKNQILAAKAYDFQAKEVHGEFARTNEMMGLLI